MQHLKFIRFMIQLLSIAILFIFSSSAFCAEIEVPIEYDHAWLATAQTIAMEGITLSEKNKDLGIIQGTKDVDSDSTYFNCERLRGRAKSHTLNISATVRKKDEVTSLISIKVEGLRKSYRNKHFLFITVGRVHDETACVSTGKLENSILSSIKMEANPYQAPGRQE